MLYYIMVAIILVVVCVYDWNHFQLKTPKEWLANIFCNTILTCAIIGVVYGIGFLINQNGLYFAVIPIVIGGLLLIGINSITTMMLKNIVRYVREE